MDTIETVGFLIADGSVVQVICANRNGVRIPIHMAEVRLVDIIDRGGTVTTAGAVALDIPANIARKGGFIRAPLGNGDGLITLTFKKADGTSWAKVLEAGSAFDLTINPGFVMPHEIAISGDTAGNSWEAVEYT